MAKAVDTRTLDDPTVANAVGWIAENLREADRAELRAAGVDNVREALAYSIGASPLSWLILDQSGLPIGAFGAARGTSSFVGDIWMVGTDGINREALSVARQTPHYVRRLNELFPLLRNYVDARNVVSMNWLEWAGFEIIDAVAELGPERRLFYEFARTPS